LNLLLHLWTFIDKYCHLYYNAAMKLSVYARKLGISYRTAWRWFKAGTIRGYQTPTGTIIITEPVGEAIPSATQQKTAIYARVPAVENQDKLEGQTKRLLDYCAANGYRVNTVVKEIGSGLNDARPKLLKLLTDPSITLIVVEQKDRLTRFGFNYIEQLLAMQGRHIEVINRSTEADGGSLAQNGREDLVQDLVSIVTSFCARLYGPGRSKRKTERILAELRPEDHP
jgi:putative resolvase